MGTSHVAGWTPESPTPAQLKELFSQIDNGRMTKKRLQAALGAYILTARVNHDDPAHRRIDQDQYAYVNPDMRIEHLPITRTGEAEMEFELLACPAGSKGWTRQNYLDEVKRRDDLWVPDFAETRDFHRDNPDARKENYILSPCGSVVEQYGDQYFAFVNAYSDGLRLYLSLVDDRWDPGVLWLAARKLRT